MKNILVTGGAGFIGSHVVENCLRKNYPVIILDNLSTGSRKNFPSEVPLLQVDLLTADLNKILKDYKIGHIFHLAAKVSVRNSTRNFIEDANVNFLGSLKLFDAALKNKVESFVFASTMAVYSDSRDKRPITEEYSTEPLSPYGVSKLAAERNMFLLSQESDCRFVALRYFNTFGPRQQFSPYVGVITIFKNALLNKKPITIFGDGNQIRDFIHVQDVADATVHALENQKVQGAFNIGSSRGLSVNELAKTLLRKFGADPTLLEYSPRVTSELTHSIADITKARKALQFSPTVTLEKYLDHPEFLG